MEEYTHVAVSVESQWLVYLCIAVKVDGVFERKIHKLSAGRGLHSFTSQLNLSSLVTPPCVPLSNRLGENHAPNVSNIMCLR